MATAVQQGVVAEGGVLLVPELFGPGRLLLRRSSYTAAAAPNSGGFVFPQPFENDYTPALMTIHGANDVVGVNLAPDIWEFFKAHPYGVDPHSWTAVPAGFSSQCMIF